MQPAAKGWERGLSPAGGEAGGGKRKRRGASPAAFFLQGAEGRSSYLPRRMMASWISMYVFVAFRRFCRSFSRLFPWA